MLSSKQVNILGLINTNLGAARQSSKFPIDKAVLVSLVLKVAGGTAPTGSLKLQVSNDPTSPGVEPTNWVDAADTTAVKAITDNGTYGLSAANVGYFWGRLIWEYTSGSGTLTVANLNLKGP